MIKVLKGCSNWGVKARCEGKRLCHVCTHYNCLQEKDGFSERARVGMQCRGRKGNNIASVAPMMMLYANGKKLRTILELLKLPAVNKSHAYGAASG